MEKPGSDGGTPAKKVELPAVLEEYRAQFLEARAPDLNSQWAAGEDLRGAFGGSVAEQSGRQQLMVDSGGATRARSSPNPPSVTASQDHICS